MKRYKLVHDPEYRSQMVVRPDGKFVLYADHEAAITAAQAEIARLRAALEYYADRNEEGYEIWITDYGGWTGYSMENGPIIDDAGAIARAALDGTQDEVTK